MGNRRFGLDDGLFYGAVTVSQISVVSRRNVQGRACRVGVLALALAPLVGQCLEPLRAQPVPINPPQLNRICTSEVACNRVILPLFWSPPGRCVPSVPSPLPNNVSMAMPKNGINFNGKRVPNILTIYNTNAATRILQVNGLASKDLMVGTPDVSDILSGASGGGDTFVVGGGSTLINFTSGSDQIIVDVPSSTERDQVILSAAGTGLQEYVYISTALERTGGTFKLSPAASGLPYWPEVQVLGGNSLLSLMPFAATPQQCISGALASLGSRPTDTNPTLIASSTLSNAAIPPQASVPGGRAVPRMVPTPPPSRWPSSARAMGGAPVLRNFVATAPGPGAEPRTKIILPLEEFRKNSLLDATSFLLDGDSKQPIPIFEVSDVAVSVPKPTDDAPSATSEEALQKAEPLGHRSGKIGPGLPLDKVPTNRYAFFYFTKDGLLVFSNNSKPLASATNPGLVIAQLIGPDDKPARLPTTRSSSKGAEPVFLARFLAFTVLPPAERATSVRQPAPARR